ncbi:MAG: DUF5706 domain-containing protein [Saprospiraceae bacterium]
MSIIQEAEQYVTTLLTEKLSDDHTYHNLAHTLKVREACLEIAKGMDINKDELEILELAALFHDTGFITQYDGHEAVSHHLAAEFLEARDYKDKKQQKVLGCIDATQVGREPQSVLEEIMKDADLLNLGSNDYLVSLANLRAEWAVILGQQYSDEDWCKLNIDFLGKHRYYTAYMDKHYSDQVDKNRKNLKKLAKAHKKDMKKAEKPVPSGITGSRSAQMMFKTALRNHLDLSNLADNKANIMISINAAIVTFALPISWSYISDFNYLLYPSITLLITCLSSMVFATLATRPIKMTGLTAEDKIVKGQANLFFFGNFFKMSFDEYFKGMQQTIDQEDRLEGAIMRDLYFLGRSLGRKYGQLRICYNIFMLGVILSVVVFLIAFNIMAR